MRYLITGGCGFLGSNIASALIKQSGNEVWVFDNLSRYGSEKNLAWLYETGNFHFKYGDIRNTNDVECVINDIQPDVIYHFAGQVAMTTSISNPRYDFEINTLGSFNIIDALRKLKLTNTAIIYSSTNKVYGDLEWVDYDELDTRYVAKKYNNGFDEKISLDFHSPYGCSKGAADQYFLDAYRIFGLKTVVFRHSSMFGGRQFSTTDQGWVGWFCSKAVEQSKGLSNSFTISGNGKQVRDILFSQDMVDLYLSAAKNIEKIKGNAFNIGGGMENSLSLIELFKILEAELSIQLKYTQLPPRESDQKIFVANISKITKAINWQPKIDKLSGIKRMLEWVKSIS